jgi:hypothetical protein
MTTAEQISASGLMKPPRSEATTAPTTRSPDLRKKPSNRPGHIRPQLHQADLRRDRPGALAMLTESDEQWLREQHPALITARRSVAGTIDFRANYDHGNNRFLILHGESVSQVEGVTLSGTFQIRIEERTDKSTSQLPALYVEGIETTPDRHFNQRDNSACLCSPFDEPDFLQPQFQFPIFLEQLVVPFLYGQVYYSSRGNWPWAEYAHGAAGILEAYSKIDDQNRVEECLLQLVQDSSWSRIQSALRQEPYIKGHTPCFCTNMDQLRRCHPRALEGVRRLQQHLKTRGIPVP